MAVIALALLLSGCAGQNDDQACRSFGFTPGTAGYAQCRQNLYAQHEESRRAALGAYAIMNQGNSGYRPLVPYQMPTNQTRYTNCYNLGDTTRCVTQ